MTDMLIFMKDIIFERELVARDPFPVRCGWNRDPQGMVDIQ